MRAVIVFESMFGNTERLATDVMAGLAEAGSGVSMSEVAVVAPQDLLGCDLVVLAAPTHALTLSSPLSRADAVGRGADPAHATTGIREWLTTLDAAMPVSSGRPSFAVFDTKVSKAKHRPGSAARGAARRLRKAGFTVVDRTTFYVEDVKGPIAAGEHERARSWGGGLVDLVAAPGVAGRGSGK